jgi:tetratricopeptide (TPR) repeat protein
MNRWTTQFLRITSIAALAAVLHGCASTQAAKVEQEDVFAEFSTEQIIEAGDAAFNQNEFDRAMFIYMQALEIEETADNWYRVGITKLKLDDKEFAWSAFGEALRLNPDHVMTHENLGLLYISSGQPEQAKQHLTKAIELDPSRWRTQNALGVMADVDDRYQDAVEHYKAALEHNPKSAMLMNNIGYSYYLATDLQQATQWFDAAIQAQPGFELAVRNLGLLYARQGWYPEAIETFISVVDKAEAYNDVGYIAMRNGDYDDASEMLAEAIRLSPTYYVTAYNNLDTLGNMMKRDGQRKDRESLADNLSEVVFAEDRETLTLQVMPQALNVRAAPTSDSEIIDYLKTGDPVEIILSKDRWTFISYRPNGVVRDLTGWVKSRYLSQNSEEGASSPLAPGALGEGPVGMLLPAESLDLDPTAGEDPAVAAEDPLMNKAAVDSAELFQSAAIEIPLEQASEATRLAD